MTKAIITHFDGDPFTLHYWLMLYRKYWRGEADKIYLTICHDPQIVTAEVEAYNKSLLAQFPEIIVEYLDHKITPEEGNKLSYQKTTEDLIGFVESDGLIFKKGLVDQMFRLLEFEKQDVVCPKWELIKEPYIAGDLHVSGFMRCFFFVKREILKKIDVDFMPKSLKANQPIPNSDRFYQQDNELDCFGWISLQIATLRPNITIVPSNVLHPDTILNPEQYEQYKWLHIRQMSSSALGIGGSEFGLWKNDPGKLLDQLLFIISHDYAGGSAEFTMIKAIAFKMLFFEALREREQLGIFAKDYKTVLETASIAYNLPTDKIYEIKGFYKALTQ